MHQKTLPLGILTLGLALISPLAHADIRYTTEMQVGGAEAAPAPSEPGDKMPGIRTTTFVKDMAERVETSFQIGPIQSNSITLTLCDKHQSIQLLPSAKVYTVQPIGAMTFATPQTGRRGGSATEMNMPEGKPGVGHVVTTLGLQDLGMEKINQIDARHIIMTVHGQTSGCLGVTDTNLKLEQWVAPLKAGLNCPERFSPMRTVPNEHGCQITYEIKGDFAKVKDLYGGMVVRQIIYGQDGKPVARQELREYSQAALSDSLFAVPADYKQVTPEEFQHDQQQAMMHALMGGGEAPDSNQADPNTPDTQNGGPQNGDKQPAQDDSKKKRPKFHIPGLPF